MPLEVRLTPKLTYKLRLSPQMRLSLNLLQLPLVKLKEYVLEQVEKNPLLEPVSSEPSFTNKQRDDNILHIEQGDSGSEVSWSEEDADKRQYRESLITASPTLREHLLKQLYLIATTDKECKIGELIIGNIDDNGYLRCPLEEIAKSSKTTKSQVEKVLNLIQSFDPAGVGARDLRECLMLQLKAKGGENSLAAQIADKYLSFLEKKRYKYVAKKLNVSIERIKDAIKEIANLEPKPGRSFSAERTLCLEPDALLKKSKEGYEVVLNDWELPSITINEKYKKMLKQKDMPDETRKYLSERLNAARALTCAIAKRQETVRKVIEDIVHFQKDCFDKGIANFKPMTLSQIANRLGIHRSTVSRAIANKYLQTPHGILELRQFLNSGVKQNNGELYSSKNIKLKILEWIRNEDKNKPFTDQEITNLFKQNGISVSRRSIAKYRTHLKILPSMSRPFTKIPRFL